MAVERDGARIVRNGFREIVANLQERVESGALPSGAYLPTERELQEQFGASRSTIRKALATLVESGWARSVPNKGVVASKGQKPSLSKSIALIDSGSFVLKVLGIRIGELLLKRGFHLVHLGGSLDYPLDYAVQHALDHEFAGAFVWSYRGFPETDLVERACRRMAVVALDHRLGTYPTDLVTFDYEQAAYDATSQLIRQGCRRIGVTGMFDMLEITHQRFRGYMHAMFDHDLQPLPEDYIFISTSGHDDARTEHLRERLASPDRPEAFVVLQDLYVPPVIEAALAAGLSVPGDLKLSTIGDDIDVTVDGAGLTAAELHWDALAQTAVEMMLKRIEDMHREVEVRFAPHRLVIRGLCGADQDSWSPPVERSFGFAGETPLARSQFRYSSRWPGSPANPRRGGPQS